MSLTSPQIITLDISNAIINHQRRDDFATGDRPSHDFAYFCLNRPYYTDSSMNLYRYALNTLVPKMIQLDHNFYPEDLYDWVKTHSNRADINDAYTLATVICNELGYNGWFIENQEYVFSRSIIMQFTPLDNIIINPIRAVKEAPYGIYYL